LKIRDQANPEGDIEIQITGLRAGEKLYEELLIGDNPAPTSHPRIMKAHEVYLSWSELLPILQQMQVAAGEDDVDAIKRMLTACVHGYHDEAEEERHELAALAN